MSEITITQTDAPSRSKQAGPCWIAVGDTYASTAARTVQAGEPGSTVIVTGKAVLRRATRISTDRETWTLYVTGNPDDKVTLQVGAGYQVVEAIVTGVSEQPPAPQPQAPAGVPEAVTNPLRLRVYQATSILPPHEVQDGAKLAAITGSMERDGWRGAPLIADPRGEQAYTGSHRIAAWEDARYADAMAGQGMPYVCLDDLAAACGIDWQSFLGERLDQDDAAAALAYAIPADIREAYGFDFGGA